MPQLTPSNYANQAPTSEDDYILFGRDSDDVLAFDHDRGVVPYGDPVKDAVGCNGMALGRVHRVRVTF